MCWLKRLLSGKRKNQSVEYEYGKLHNQLMEKWRSFYDLYLKSENGFLHSLGTHNVSPFLIYTEGVRVMNAPYVEVSAFVENGVYYYTYTGGTTHMNGFGSTGVIPVEFVRNDCVVLGVILTLIGGAYGFISPRQEDNYLLVDFKTRSVHPLENAVCSVCGKTIDVFPQEAYEPFCMNGEIFCRSCFREKNWRQTLIKDFLSIGKRGDHYYYAIYNTEDCDYSGYIPDALIRDAQLDIEEFLTYAASENGNLLFSERAKKITAPYIFDVNTRKLKCDIHPICEDCGMPLVDKNIEDNCVDLSHSIYDKNKKAYCVRCWEKNI